MGHKAWTNSISSHSFVFDIGVSVVDEQQTPVSSPALQPLNGMLTNVAHLGLEHLDTVRCQVYWPL